MNRKDITKVKISQMIILWTVEVVFLTTGCIRLAKNMINGYGRPNIYYKGKRVDLSLRLRKIFRIKKKRAPQLARDILYEVFYLWGLYIAALISTAILKNEHTILIVVFSILYFSQFIPLLIYTVLIIVEVPMHLVCFIKKHYKKRNRKK